MIATVPSAGALSLRAPKPDDLQAVFDLVTESDVREFGEPDYPFEEFAANWHALDLAADSRVAVRPDGRIVGWATVEDGGRHAKLHGEAYVHPDFEGIGVGSNLVRWTEERAAAHLSLAPAGVRVALLNACNARNARAHALFRALGYNEVRHFWRMQIDLVAPDPSVTAPSRPDGIAIRAIAGEVDERRLFAAVQEAYRDHWGHVPVAFEVWTERKKRHGYDPALWLMALDGEEVAGALVGSVYTDAGGWINDVTVRRPWRRRGVALALLQEAFRRFVERGQTNVALGVDATNPTGATRLYERAGMRVTHEFAYYEKELRPGVEPGPDEEE